MKQTKKLRELLGQKKTLVLPGAYDCFSAKIIEKMGFKAVYLTGYGCEASMLGKPDMGFTQMNDVADLARRMALAVDLPIVADADLGFGGTLSITRTVEEFERAGVAAIHIEDQAIPLKCAGMPGLKFISCEEMCMRIRAAVAARKNEDFLIIGRSDIFAPTHDFEETVCRLKAYKEAGADLLIAGGSFSEEHLYSLCKEFPNQICINCGLSLWKESMLPVAKYEDMGAAMLFYALAGLTASAKAMENTFTQLKNGYLSEEYLKENNMGMRQVEEIVDYSKYIEIEKRFSLE